MPREREHKRLVLFKKNTHEKSTDSKLRNLLRYNVRFNICFSKTKKNLEP